MFYLTLNWLIVHLFISYCLCFHKNMRHNMQHAIENPIKQYKIYFFLIVRNKKI
jgi:hypothetical protein